jgi:hypothetical protein
MPALSMSKICMRCNVEMGNGVAILPVYSAGISDFGDDDLRGQTMSPAPGGKLISVTKCPSCGHSVSDTKVSGGTKS